MHLDQRDLDILRILSRDGRITKAALADQVGLSPTPCWERLKKLEKAGLIEKSSRAIVLVNPNDLQRRISAAWEE